MIKTVKIIGMLASLCGCSSTYDGAYAPAPEYASYPYAMTVVSKVEGSGQTNRVVVRVNAASEAHCWQIADAMERGTAGQRLWIKPVSCLPVEE